ncbi:alcohol dehydrogenase catalytic domain-containing protein [Companilactobacillus ginsenosidimutans]|uniref:alcohol dehydrogenase catalytic domain-containing protein n=1 Tax=Companilactobacillus ginsenosidimutans TaxID=1007676 RepID=UPI000B07C4E0|nr:alcohol dehydrogenase catalytic domain-containing protein [Companilactobacillus ginsenosidimutans]
MKSVVIEKAVGPEVLDIKERPIPEATKDETVIKIHAFTVHRYEVLTREGGSPSVKFPRVIGVEAVGEVYQPAENSELKKGQKIVSFNGGLGRAFDGSYQEYALIPDNLVYPVDFDGSWTELASIPETFYTAFGALKSINIAEGQSLLVRGGTTGVGMAALVLAKAM